MICRLRLSTTAKPQAASLRLLQLDRPVSIVEEALPRLVLAVAQLQVHQRAAFRLLRLANQGHAGLAGSPATLPHVAGDAGADDVFPGRLSALAARHHVVQAQFTRRELLAAVLTLVV